MGVADAFDSVAARVIASAPVRLDGDVRFADG